MSASYFSRGGYENYAYTRLLSMLEKTFHTLGLLKNLLLCYFTEIGLQANGGIMQSTSRLYQPGRYHILSHQLLVHCYALLTSFSSAATLSTTLPTLHDLHLSNVCCSAAASNGTSLATRGLTLPCSQYCLLR